MESKINHNEDDFEEFDKLFDDIDEDDVDENLDDIPFLNLIDEKIE